MNLLRNLRYIPSFMPEVTSFQAFVKITGSSIRMETLQALDRFVRDCYNTGVWANLIEVYPFCGEDLTAAMTKLKNYAIAPALTAVNMVEADYTERGPTGGIAGNGSTKYVDSNYAASNFPANAHISVYLREDVPTPTQYLVGANNAGATEIAGISATAATQTSAFLGKTNGATEVASPVKGFLYAERTSPTSLILYRNNVQIGNSAINTAVAYPAMNFYIGARNNAGAASSLGNKKISFASFGLPLTAQQRSDFYNIVQAFQTNLSRNV
jgi:hypothetical protein